MQTETTTISETINNAFPFEVERFPLTGPDGMQTPHYGLFKSDDSDCVGVAVRRGYTPHTRDDLAALAEAAIGAMEEDRIGFGKMECHWSGDSHYLLIEGDRDAAQARFNETYRNAGAHQIIRDSDVCVPSLIVNAGYDGTAFQARMTLQRIVCKNTLSIPVEGKQIVRKIKHTAGLRLRIADLADEIRMITGRVDSIINTVEDAKSKTVNMADFIRTVYPIDDDATERQRNAFERRVEAIMTRLHRERNTLGILPDPEAPAHQATAWEAFNAVQGYVQHDARRRGKPSREQRAVMALKDSAVERAAALAF